MSATRRVIDAEAKLVTEPTFTDVYLWATQYEKGGRAYLGGSWATEQEARTYDPRRAGAKDSPPRETRAALLCVRVHLDDLEALS